MQRIQQVRNRLLIFPLSTMVLLVLLFYFSLLMVQKSFQLQSEKTGQLNERFNEFIIEQNRVIAEAVARGGLYDPAKPLTSMIEKISVGNGQAKGYYKVVFTDEVGNFIGGSRATYDDQRGHILQRIARYPADDPSAQRVSFITTPIMSQAKIVGWSLVYLDMNNVERLMAEHDYDHHEIEEQTQLSIMVTMGIFIIVGSMLSFLLYRLAYAALMGDVKKRITAEYYYAESEANLARAQELTHIGNWKYDPSNGKLKVSRELLKILDIQQKNGTRIYPLTLMRRVAAEERQHLAGKIRECLKERKNDSLEIQIEIGGTTARHLLVIFDHGMSRENKSIHLFGTVQDITGRIVAEQNHKQIQYALYQSSKMASLGLMSASIVHELKNPLTAVIGYAEILQSRQKTGVDNGVVADKMLGAAQRMRSVIDHLRSYCREDKDSDWEKLDPNGPVMSALNFLHHLAKREDVAYDLALGTDLPSINGNGSMLESVFQNLVTNSIDAFSEGKGGSKKVISVRSCLEDDQIVIVYEDNAGGMNDAVRTKIFEAFFTTKPVGKGTGLGMSITRDIIKEHGGTINVASEIDKGTRFEIRLPVPQSASQPSTQAA